MSYLARNFSHAAEVRLLRWSDGPKGATVTFELPPVEVGAGHPFKGLEGVRFRMQFDPIRDDETVAAPAPPSRDARPETTPSTAAVDTPNHPKNTAASERFKALGKPEQMVAKCAMLCADHGFQNWLQVDNAEDAARKVRLACRINSRNELASNPEAQCIWQRMVTDYDVWRGALPEIR